MEHLPVSIYFVFGVTVLLAILLFYKATNRSNIFWKIVVSWLLFQTIISSTGFYKNTDTFPPRFALLLLPPIIMIIWLFVSLKGRLFIDNLDLKTLTLFHIVRIPVELVLFWLYTYKVIPGLMTFEGGNLDIFSGLSAPFIYYVGFVKKKLSKRVILFWNFVCLALLMNIVFHAILALPTGFQRFGFEQPNIALLYFPFVLLPTCLVPLVLLSHLASFRKLLFGKEKNASTKISLH